jgi:hypothetical protein
MLKQFTKLLCSLIITTAGLSIIADYEEYQNPSQEQQLQQRLTPSSDYTSRAVQDQMKARRENVERAFRVVPRVKTKSAITITPSGPVTTNPYAHL